MLVPLTIGGLGVQEGVIAYTLSWYGVPLSVGAAVALINRMAVWLVGLIGGLVFAGNQLGTATSLLLKDAKSDNTQAGWIWLSSARI